ncbi:MAG: hypothetical protein HY360_05235 [Verrucomicrobia bacterium]|nr:hypothetical protein [Verrucomicrobiota bacterium]
MNANNVIIGTFAIALVLCQQSSINAEPPMTTVNVTETTSQPGKLISSLLVERDDFRWLFVGSKPLEGRLNVEKCIRRSVCLVDGDLFKAKQQAQHVDGTTTVGDILSKVNINRVGRRQPQIKLITKNAIYQSELLERDADDLLKHPVRAGDIIYVSNIF